MHFDHCAEHNGRDIQIGPYQVYTGGTSYGRPVNDDEIDIVVSLNRGRFPGMDDKTVDFFIRDMQVPDDQALCDFLVEKVFPNLEEGANIMVNCTASHGRTGLFLACMLGLLEPKVANPVVEIRKRHCDCAIETPEQEHFVHEFRRTYGDVPKTTAA